MSFKAILSGFETLDQADKYMGKMEYPMTDMRKIINLIETTSVDESSTFSSFKSWASEKAKKNRQPTTAWEGAPKFPPREYSDIAPEDIITRIAWSIIDDETEGTIEVNGEKYRGLPIKFSKNQRNLRQIKCL